MKAEFLEETGSVDEVKAYLDDLVQKRCPELLEAMVFFVEFLLRHDDRDGAEELMERFSTEGRVVGCPQISNSRLCRSRRGRQRVHRGVHVQLLLEGAPRPHDGALALHLQH